LFAIPARQVIFHQQTISPRRQGSSWNSAIKNRHSTYSAAGSTGQGPVGLISEGQSKNLKLQSEKIDTFIMRDRNVGDVGAQKRGFPEMLIRRQLKPSRFKAVAFSFSHAIWISAVPFPLGLVRAEPIPIPAGKVNRER
jgi:hypothetical protein